MAAVHLVLALALVAFGWLAIVRFLAFTCAGCESDAAPERLSRGVRPWANRLLLSFPEPTGPINSAAAVAVSRRKDLV